MNTNTQVILPKRRTHVTPRMLRADAYTIGSNKFQSKKAKEKSVYYITFRRELCNIDNFLYKEGDNRIVFVGLQRIIERLLYNPITHDEIDETVRFLEFAKATQKGFVRYDFPTEVWRKVVDIFNGYPPIKITAMPEGSIVYPNEPVIMIESLDEELTNNELGELGAWFESKLLQVYGTSERATQDRHWLNRLIDMVGMVNPDMPHEEKQFYASLMLADFGDRAGLNDVESEDQGMTHLYNFGGTDTFAGAYQAWKNSNEDCVGVFSSVNALAHRNVQAYVLESDCYNAIYDSCDDNEFISMVADCYNYFNATEKYLIPLALKSVVLNNNKIIVARPDSGDALEQILWSIELAIKNNLFTTQIINGKTWYFSTTFKIIEADGMKHKNMWDIMMVLIERGYVPYSWLLFGVGGGNRNELKRDNLSAKYALCAIGNDYQPVCKFSETLGKATLGGQFKVLRDDISLKNCQTIVNNDEIGDNVMVEYYNGLNRNKPFGIGQDDDFLTIKNRINEQFSFMPLTLKTVHNHNYPASDKLLNIRKEILSRYDSTKNTSDY